MEASNPSSIGPYRILEVLGEGGMGTVHLAEQREPVQRRVALKLIKLGMDSKAVLARFEAERRALSMMEHSSIATVLDAGMSEQGQPYFVMEYVKGIPITDYCDQNRLTLSDRIELFQQVCAGVHHAHQKGVMHRDLKPGNVLVAQQDGKPVPKIIDFGLAKAMDHHLVEATVFTEQGEMIGTPEYMSPEQAAPGGLGIDTRTDVYSLGVLLYELLVGQRPFSRHELRGSGLLEMQRVIREQEPAKPSTKVTTLGELAQECAAARQLDASELRHKLHGDLDWIVLKALEKDRTRRYETPQDLAADLERHLQLEPVVARPPSAVYVAKKFARRHRPRILLAAAILIAAAASVFALSGMQQSTREREARDLLPQIRELIGENDYIAAYDLGVEAERTLGDDPALRELWPEMSYTITADSTPSGARVFARPIQEPDAEPVDLGTTPLTNVRVPRAFFRWELQKDGFDSRVFLGTRLVPLELLTAGSTPPGMVHVQTGSLFGGLTGLEHYSSMPAGSYFLDKFEVTNGEFAEFVAAGGYRERRFWKHEFEKNGASLSWEQAMSEFVDATGGVGPASWADGAFPDGKRDHPVAGVSWYEAQAYAEFRGKSLPTVFHWATAISTRHAHYYIPLSNFDGESTAVVGSYPGISRYGAYDMAGNVREWCSNATSGGARYCLGGAYIDAPYVATDPDALDPFDRSEIIGFRCALYLADALPPAASLQVLDKATRDYATEQPVTDEIFEIYRGLYDYDARPLRPAPVGEADLGAYRRESVAIDTAYGDGRFTIHLLIPKAAVPPYRAVCYFPGSGAITQKSSLETGDWGFDFILGSACVVVRPVLEGTYERRNGHAGSAADETRFYRDWVIHMAQDVRRTVDYLATRRDFDRDRLTYYGVSWGARMGPLMLALEDRFESGILLSGGLSSGRCAPEVDPYHFAKRVQLPVLMLNGYHDFYFPLETSQKVMFELLGTPSEHKKHVVYRFGGHSLVGGKMRGQATREILDWLQR